MTQATKPRTVQPVPDAVVVPAAAPRRPIWGAGLLLVLLTFAAYLPAFAGDYFWDDDQYITQNADVQRLDGLPRLWALWYDYKLGRMACNTPQYYPVMFTSFWLEWRLWGDSKWGYHAVSILVHALTALVVWGLGRRLALRGAWLLAAVFALHPVLVESVAWVAERKTLLAGLFYLLAIWAYVNVIDYRRVRDDVLCWLCFLLALLSKQSATTLPAVLLVLVLWRTGRVEARHLRRIVPMLLLVAFYGWVTISLESRWLGQEGGEPDWNYTLWERLALLVPHNLLHYARVALWPHPLMTVYPRGEFSLHRLADWLPLATCLAVAAVLLLGRRRWGKAPLALAALIVIVQSPVLAVFDISWFNASFVADHFLHVGLLPYVALGGLAAGGLLRRIVPSVALGTVRTAGAVVVLAALGVLTFRQCLPYRSSIEYWQKALDNNPRTWIAMCNLAYAYVEIGDQARARELYNQARQFPAAKAFANAHLLPLLVGDDTIAAKEVIGELTESVGTLATRPVGGARKAEAFRRAAASRLAAGDLRGAVGPLRVAVEAAPDRAPYRVELAALHQRLGDYPAAAAQYAAAYELDPNLAVVQHGLLECLARAGQSAEALAQARALHASGAADPLALRRLGWLLAADPDERWRDGPGAVELARLLTGSPADGASEAAGGAPPPSRVDDLDLLAAALAETGSFDEAAAVAERAVTAAKAESRDTTALEGRLELYRAGRPYRAPAAESQPG